MRLPLCKTVALLFSSVWIWAAPPATTPHIKIDQFGYLPSSKKVAVIVDPQTGYNAAESFSPGLAANNYQVRRWNDDVVVLSGTLTAWNGGATHTQSGDKGWWFDFSSLTTPGSYYIFDQANNKGSYRFEIGNTVYDEVLKQVLRTFFYQRLNFAKATPYADSRWADGAAFEGSNQDRYARSRWAKTDAATARDLHGGWMDAGDYNKYTTFTFAPLCTMLETYRLYPNVFKDNYNIPESGNGVPDMLDEIKWELEWLKRMQDASGTHGFFLKVGVDNYNSVSPPSNDANARYYLGECTSATLTGAAVFALASITYRQVGTPTAIAFADDLLARAQAAWTRALTTTSNFTTFETTCDDGDIKAGDADASIAEQRDRAVTAAAYLFEATGLATYRTWFDNLYTQAQPYASWWWGPYYTAVQRAMLRYARLSGATPSVSSNILSMKGGQNGVMSITDYNNGTDLYRAYMPDAQYHWGNSQAKADAAVHNWDFVSFNVNSANHPVYKEVAETYLHWFHGVNPMGKVLLSNMYAYGGDDCANEIYHAWFGNGTVWDNALTSLYGPPPGYLHGGPNKNYNISGVAPPYGQPAQKSYKDWNTVWNGSYSENSWEITEPAIYTQGSYIALLARVMGNQPAIVLPVSFTSFTARRTPSGNVLSWEVEADEAIRHFEIERSGDGRQFSTVQTKAPQSAGAYQDFDTSGEARGRKVFYRIRAVKEGGGVAYSSVVALPLAATAMQLSPNPARESVQLTGHQTRGGKLVVSWFDASGRLVVKQEWQSPAGTYSRTLPISHLQPGLYWVQVKDAEKSESFRIIKAK